MTAPTSAPRLRRGARTDYRHFPAEYVTLVEMLERDSVVTLGPFPESMARSTIRDIYRWKMMLLHAWDDSQDALAKELHDTLAACRLSVQAASTGFYIIGEVNPVLSAIRQAARTPSRSNT